GALVTFLDNCFKIFVGSSFPIAMIIVFLYGLCFALYGHRPHFKKRWIAGTIIAYIGLLMWLQTVMFQRLNLHAKVIKTTWNSLSKVIFNGDSTVPRSEEHTSELQSRFDLVCRLLLEKKNTRICLS